MVMATLQVRLTHPLVERLDALVKQGLYGSRSDAVRDAVRRVFWEGQVGTIQKKGTGVQLARKARKKLTLKKSELKEINSL